MAASMAFTFADSTDGSGFRSGIQQLIVTWTSDSGGASSGTSPPIYGTLIKGVTDPGSAAPTDNYDITITDANGIDVLASCKKGLSDRDTTNSEEVYFMVLNNDTSPLSMAVQPVVGGPLTIAIAAAGDTKNGVLKLFYKP